MRRLVIGMALANGGLAAGCFGVPPEKVAPVSGEVRRDGKPLAEAVIIFHRIGSKERNLTARSEADGTCRMTTHQPGEDGPNQLPTWELKGR